MKVAVALSQDEIDYNISGKVVVYYRAVVIRATIFILPLSARVK